MEFLVGLRDNVPPFLLVLTIVVFVHEMGHFLVARWNGVRIDTFSIGFGPELIGWTDRRGTRWKLSLMPLGGYVKMFGDADAASATADTTREMTSEERAVSFQHKRLLQRAAIVVAGPLANVIFAIVVFTVMFATIGEPIIPPVVGEVVAGSAADAGGVRAGDRIVQIDGHSISQFGDIQRLVLLSSGGVMTVAVDRGGKSYTLSVTPRMAQVTDNFGNVHRSPLLGIKVSGALQLMVRHGPWKALTAALKQTYDVGEGALVSMGQMIAGTRGADDLGGPLRIAQFSSQAARNGAANFITFVAFLSINLGLINIFPVPLLDGGHLLFYAIEGLRGRPLAERTQEFGLKVGMILVMSLMVFATWNDLIHMKVLDYLIRLVS
ncbi:MAG: RIP metalloprotease RseP [Alphaproteobacteria bacterium]|nr:RIP metalloprotease RseP [Alphaproteobacteria bacterium]